MLDGGRYRAPAIVPRIVRWTLRLPVVPLEDVRHELIDRRLYEIVMTRVYTTVN